LLKAQYFAEIAVESKTKLKVSILNESQNLIAIVVTPATLQLRLDRSVAVVAGRNIKTKHNFV